jgi:hypothetical protein
MQQPLRRNIRNQTNMGCVLATWCPESLKRDTLDVIAVLVAGIARGRVREQIPATSAGTTRDIAVTSASSIVGTSTSAQ